MNAPVMVELEGETDPLEVNYFNKYFQFPNKDHNVSTILASLAVNCVVCSSFLEANTDIPSLAQNLLVSILN